MRHPPQFHTIRRHCWRLKKHPTTTYYLPPLTHTTVTLQYGLPVHILGTRCLSSRRTSFEDTEGNDIPMTTYYLIPLSLCPIWTLDNCPPFIHYKDKLKLKSYIFHYTPDQIRGFQPEIKYRLISSCCNV